MTVKKLNLLFSKGESDSKEIKPSIFKMGKVTVKKLNFLFSKGGR